MEINIAHITARSEKEAMDWSLVLASQGIEAFIDCAEEDGRWRLRISPAEFERAQSAIRLYRLENRGRVWRQELRWTGLLFDWRAGFWFCLLVALHALNESGRASLEAAGLMSSDAVRAGEWWRLFTAITLHADWVHLAGNVSSGLVLLGLAMGSYGAGRAVLASFLAGAGGNALWLLGHAENHLSVGASGMVMGALGLLAVHSLSLRHHGAAAAQLIVRGVLAGLLLFVILGLNRGPRVDIVAHLGGFVSGCLLGLILVLLPERWTKSPRFDTAAGLLCIALVVVTWTLALR